MKRLAIGVALFVAGVLVTVFVDSLLITPGEQRTPTFEAFRFAVFMLAMYPCAHFTYMRTYKVPAWRYALLTVVGAAGMALITATTSVPTQRSPLVSLAVIGVLVFSSLMWWRSARRTP